MNEFLAPTPRALRIYTKVVAVSTLFLIFAGAMVTSTGSGLAVPDWPLSYGMLMPPMVGGIFYEHGHRMIATAVGLLTLIQAFWLQRREPKPFLRRLGWASLGAVLAQGALGGITVLFLLPKPISISHAALAEIFLSLNVAIAFFASASYEAFRARRGSAGDHRAVTRLLVGAIFVQMLLGAWMRHLGAALAIPDYPLSLGRIIPPFDTIGIVANFAHRTFGLAVAAIAVVAAARVVREGGALRNLAWTILGALAVQITLGAFTIWSGRNEIIASFHVMTGAATLALSVLLALAASVLGRAPAAAPRITGQEVPA
ncbi:MAG TPA: COX15/CtaA family protein [Thermoanaerobaculia bacterium]